MNRASPIILPLVAAATLAASDGHRATLTYEANGRHTLHAYDVKPTQSSGETDVGTKRLDGSPPRLNPAAYFCVWRDTGPDGYGGRGLRTGRPSEIFLTCRFGTSPWSPPADLIEAATEDLKRESALIRIGWTRSANGYVMKRFELELKKRGALRFRSQNLTERELSELGISVSKMVAPSMPQGRLVIHLTARIPSRMNSGMKAIDPIIPIEFEGAAMPIPNWMSY